MLRRKTAIISGAAALALAGAVAGGVASAQTGGSNAAATAAAPAASAALSATDTAATALVAQTADVATAARGEGDGARALCRRAPRLETRIEAVLARLDGPATERGSLAALRERVQDARAKGDTAVAGYLNDRLTFRSSLVGTLRQRESDLKSVQSWCGSRGSAAG